MMGVRMAARYRRSTSSGAASITVFELALQCYFYGTMSSWRRGRAAVSDRAHPLFQVLACVTQRCALGAPRAQSLHAPSRPVVSHSGAAGLGGALIARQQWVDDPGDGAASERGDPEEP